MSKKFLEQQLGVVSSLIEGRLCYLQTDAEKQQFIEGIFFMLDILTRHCAVDFDRLTEALAENQDLKDIYSLTPFEQQKLLMTIKANVYSKANSDKNLDSKTYMQPLIKSESEYVLDVFKNASALQRILSMSSNPEEDEELRNLLVWIGLVGSVTDSSM
tara:strand:+ start:410 stop:886 length:477 start_codon:yes stop_codon:yes gene_type:complete